MDFMHWEWKFIQVTGICTPLQLVLGLLLGNSRNLPLYGRFLAVWFAAGLLTSTCLRTVIHLKEVEPIGYGLITAISELF